KAVGCGAVAGSRGGLEAMGGGTGEAFGGVDTLHNTAFGQPPLPPGQSRLAFTGDLDEHVWAHVINIGLTSVFRATKRAIPELLQRGGGDILNTASLSGLFHGFAIR